MSYHSTSSHIIKQQCRQVAAAFQTFVVNTRFPASASVLTRQHNVRDDDDE